jgi:hypothetical protein
LVQWALGLRVRHDVHGRYFSSGTDADGRPVIKSYTVHRPLDGDVVYRHYTDPRPETITGLHITGPDERCRVIVIDIDRHSADDPDPATNCRYAEHLYHVARNLGLDCLLFDSDGRGGYHVWIIIQQTVPAADAFRLGRWLVRDYEAFGLARQPESFPKSPRLTGKRIGGWIRLPGHHHKRDHYTRVWDDDRREWLEGDAAVEAIVSVTGKDVDIAAMVPADFTGTQPPRSARTGITEASATTRPPKPDRACVAGSRPVRTSRPGQPGDSGNRRDAALAEDALRVLGPDHDYARWITVGMALAELGDAGLELWHRWASRSPKYDPESLDAKWASFRPGSACGGVTLGTLYMLARNKGWAGQGTDATLPGEPPAVIRAAFARSVKRLSRTR